MLEPMYDHIVVKNVDKSGEKMVGSIILQSDPDQNFQFSEAEVIAVGPGYKVDGKLVPLRVKQGDIIIYRNMAGIPITDEGVDYHITSESTVVAIKS